MVIEKIITTNKKTGRQKNLYCCEWCGAMFEQEVRRSFGKSRNFGKSRKVGSFAEKPDVVSDQVVCVRCKNILKTWE